MASNLVAMASNPIVMASNLLTMAFNLLAMASNLVQPSSSDDLKVFGKYGNKKLGAFAALVSADMPESAAVDQQEPWCHK